MRTPVRIGIIAMVLNMLFNLVLVIPLHHYWQVGHLGLAAATSLSAFINAILLFLTLRKKAIYQPSRGWFRFFVGLVISVAIMLLVLSQLLQIFGGSEAIYYQDWLQRITSIALLCGLGFIAYVASLFVFGFRLSDMRGPAKATDDSNK
jgi:putative peptidoglycan lipid II flippase